MTEPVHATLVRYLIREGVITFERQRHDPVRCDGREVCVCPDPNFRWVLADEYRDHFGEAS